MGESEQPTVVPEAAATAEAEAESVTSEDEFYHQAVILDQCFNQTRLSPRMQAMLERMRWAEFANEAKRAHRFPRRSA